MKCLLLKHFITGKRYSAQNLPAADNKVILGDVIFFLRPLQLEVLPLPLLSAWLERDILIASFNFGGTIFGQVGLLFQGIFEFFRFIFKIDTKFYTEMYKSRYVSQIKVEFHGILNEIWLNCNINISCFNNWEIWFGWFLLTFWYARFLTKLIDVSQDTFSVSIHFLIIIFESGIQRRYFITSIQTRGEDC